MKLRNPFPPRTRELFRDTWECWDCGENGQSSGGLELHHITGRNSDSPFNAAILCKRCHARANHSQREEIKYTIRTVLFLYNLQPRYQPTDEDMEHFKKNPYLATKELLDALEIKTGP